MDDCAASIQVAVLYIWNDQMALFEQGKFSHPVLEQHQFCKIMTLGEAQQITAHVRQQNPDCTEVDLVRAFNHFRNTGNFYVFR
jgi:hypothetical protein